MAKNGITRFTLISPRGKRCVFDCWPSQASQVKEKLEELGAVYNGFNEYRVSRPRTVVNQLRRHLHLLSN